MKKFKIFIFALLLTLPIFSVNAQTPVVNNKDYNYSYNQNKIWLYNQGIRSTPSLTTTFSLCSNKGQCHKFTYETPTDYPNAHYAFYLHEAVGSTYTYQGYCLHIGKFAHEIDSGGTPKLKTYMGLTKVKNNEGVNLSDPQKKLLENLLSNAYHYNSLFTETIDGANTTSKIKMIATQILVWEVVEGGRTSFDTIKPNVYSDSDSFYSGLVKANKVNKKDTNGLSLYDAYSGIVKDVQEATEDVKIPAAITNYNTEEKAYTLQHNVKNDYYTITTGNLGNFTKVESSDGLRVSLKDKELTIISEDDKDGYFGGIKKIVLSYTAGSTDSGLKDFYYFKFKLCKNNSCFVPKNWQDIILGAKQTVYEKTIYVKCAKGAFKINKVDGKTGKAVSGVTFEIRNSKGILMKFNKLGSSFTYNESGSTTSLVEANANVYQIINMPSDEYTLVETASDGSHALSPNEADRTTKFKFDGERFSSFDKNQNGYKESEEAIITVYNYATQVQILKSGSAGIMLQGIQFKLFDESKTVGIPLSYDKTNDKYIYDSSNGDDSVILETNSAGKITIDGLPFGNYMLQEIKTLEGYTIQKEWTPMNVTSTVSTQYPYILSITNAKGEFNFYKIDENGNYLTGGTFKIQKYDKETGKYIDQGITEIDSSNSNTNIYKIDSNSNNYTFKTKKGIATFQEVEAGAKYKIIELEAPDGYQTVDLESDNATVEIDSDGYAKNSATIINKSIIVETDASSNAELIVSIRTGQTVIKYVIVIGTIFVILGILLFLKKKLGK